MEVMRRRSENGSLREMARMVKEFRDSRASPAADEWSNSRAARRRRAKAERKAAKAAGW